MDPKILSLSGIDISKFAPHSTRSAAVTSAFKCGVPLDVILKTANWSNSQTFFKYYNKPSDKVESFKNILDKKDWDFVNNVCFIRLHVECN